MNIEDMNLLHVTEVLETSVDENNEDNVSIQLLTLLFGDF